MARSLNLNRCIVKDNAIVVDGMVLVDCDLLADWLFQIKLLIFMYGNLILNVMTKKCSDAGKSISSLKTICTLSLDDNIIYVYINLRYKLLLPGKTFL